MNIFKSSIGFLGRALFSIIFIASAVNQLFDWQGTMQYLNHGMTNWLALNVGSELLQSFLEWGLANASLLLIVAIIFQLIGGLMVFLGLWVRLGALLLLLFLIPASLIFHDFWQLQGADRMMQMIMFMKNISIIGGTLFLIAYGKGCNCTNQHENVSKTE